jgi:hypothetical protein
MLLSRENPNGAGVAGISVKSSRRRPGAVAAVASMTRFGMLTVPLMMPATNRSRKDGPTSACSAGEPTPKGR